MGCGASAQGRASGSVPPPPALEQVAVSTAEVGVPPPPPASEQVPSLPVQVPVQISHKKERLQVHTFVAPAARPTVVAETAASSPPSCPAGRTAHSLDVREATPTPAAAAAPAASNRGVSSGEVPRGDGGGGGGGSVSSLSSSFKARAKASPYPQHHQHPTEQARELMISTTASLGTTGKAVLFVDSPEIHEFAVSTSPPSAARLPSPRTKEAASSFGERPGTAGSMFSDTGCLDLFDFEEASTDRQLLGEIESLVANMESSVLCGRAIISDGDEAFMQDILDDLEADADDEDNDDELS